MATFYITKYALSSGIPAIESEPEVNQWHKAGEYSVRDTRYNHYASYTHKEAFTDPAAAVANAEARRAAKIASLKKQIAKLEKLDFAAIIRERGNG